MKYWKSDYPWSVIYEDKFSTRTGKQYGATSIGYKSVKDKNATGKDKYETHYINFFDPADMLKLSALCLRAYSELMNLKQAERASKPQTAEERQMAETASAQNPAPVAPAPQNKPFIDDDIPF